MCYARDTTNFNTTNSTQDSLTNSLQQLTSETHFSLVQHSQLEHLSLKFSHQLTTLRNIVLTTLLLLIKMLFLLPKNGYNLFCPVLLYKLREMNSMNPEYTLYNSCGGSLPCLG